MAILRKQYIITKKKHNIIHDTNDISNIIQDGVNTTENNVLHNTNINTNTIIHDIIDKIIQQKILSILKNIHKGFPDKFKKECINIEYDIIKNNICIINQPSKNIPVKDDVIHNNNKNNKNNKNNIDEQYKCNARIWGNIYNKNGLQKITNIDNTFKNNFKYSEFNKQYIIGQQCSRIKYTNSIYCHQHIKHLTHGNYFVLPTHTMCVHYIKKYL